MCKRVRIQREGKNVTVSLNKKFFPGSPIPPDGNRGPQAPKY